MTIRTGGGFIELVATCPSEDAEPLLQALLDDPGATVDWRECQSAHAAVIQVLIAARPKLLGPPANALLREWVAPAITTPDAQIASHGGAS